MFDIWAGKCPGQVAGLWDRRVERCASKTIAVGTRVHNHSHTWYEERPKGSGSQCLAGVSLLRHFFMPNGGLEYGDSVTRVISSCAIHPTTWLPWGKVSPRPQGLLCHPASSVPPPPAPPDSAPCFQGCRWTLVGGQRRGREWDCGVGRGRAWDARFR